MRREEWDEKNNVRRIRREEQEVRIIRDEWEVYEKKNKKIWVRRYIKIPSTAHSKSLWCLDVLKMLTH